MNTSELETLIRTILSEQLTPAQTDAPRDKCGYSGAINHGHTCCHM